MNADRGQGGPGARTRPAALLAIGAGWSGGGRDAEGTRADSAVAAGRSDAEWLREIPGFEQHRLEHLLEVSSTNDLLRADWSLRPPPARVVVADHQTGGRGRGDHRWTDAAGRSLCMSFSLSISGHDPRLPWLPIVVGLAVAAVCEQGARVAVKWPNDIYGIGPGCAQRTERPRKIAGVLVEAAHVPPAAFVVVGIGVNVLGPAPIATGIALDELWAVAGDFPPRAAPRSGGDRVGRRADAAASHRGVELSPHRLIIPILDEFARRWSGSGVADWQGEFERAGVPFLGSRVRVVDPAGDFSGLAVGIDAGGRLRVAVGDAERLIADPGVVSWDLLAGGG